MSFAYGYYSPSLIGRGMVPWMLPTQQIAQNPLWRRGNFLEKFVAGSLVNPDPNGVLAAVNPNLFAAPIIAYGSSAGAPQQTLYAFYTYLDGSGGESQPSNEFFIEIPRNGDATVEVPSAGAPETATDFALYVGLLSGSEVQQVASTALGSAATVPYPLTNYAGVNRASTNADANIVGMATNDYDTLYQSGPAAAQQNTSQFGADQSAPPAGFPEQYQAKVYGLQNVEIEISLVQPWYPSLLNTGAGILYDAASNSHVADTSQSNKILTIVRKVLGANNPNYDSVGGNGDTGARIVVKFNSGLI